jgi:hypothetical protein
LRRRPRPDPNPNTRHKPPPAFVVELRALPGVDGIRSLRALLKIAKRRLGLVAIDVRQCAPDARKDKRALAPTMEDSMSAFSNRVRSQKKGFFKVADLEGGEMILTISRLDEEMEVFGETKDLLNFEETGQQLQLNQTTSEWLLDNLGDDPEKYSGKQVTLFLAEYEYNKEKKLGIRLKLPGAATQTATPPTGKRSAPSAGNGNKPAFDDEVPF